MEYKIEKNFLCPGCGEVVPVVFCDGEEVTVGDTGLVDEHGKLARREFNHPTVCGACGANFCAFIRVWFYHNNKRVTAYDSGKVVQEEIGVAVPAEKE